MCSSDLAEAYAVLQAVSWHLNSQHHKVPFLVYTDSLSTILALRKPKLCTGLLQDIVRKVISGPAHLGHIAWVKAHVGVLGNEVADHLAKAAATSQDGVSRDYVVTPSSHVKRALKNHMIRKWQEAWDTTDKGRFTFRFLPTVSLDLLEGSPLRNMFLTGRGPKIGRAHV